MTELLSLLAYGDAGWGDEIIGGVLVTVSLSLATLPVGIAGGLAMALAKRSADPALRLSANIYTTIFRGLPELLTLFLVYYGGQSLINAMTGATGLPALTLSSFVSGMIALGLVFSAFASEVFLSAFQAISPGQAEAGRALGMHRFAIGYKIVFPQLMRHALPGLSNCWQNLLKDTALVSVIGLADIMRQTGVAARVTREPFLFFSLACVLFLILTFVSGIGISRIEQWTRRGEAAR
ncbi:ABC transporter permease [Aureimonas fodinaquatilis]|uniref:ABC transporter permease n=1 Tax=Aureimonas fodinaquatilis TaxID=2565783 RepID=A0A5B0DTU8_9HYPH|nr:ABC transporter permease [Aureimonas fodinaquatilis]KAA0970184.1 ABC transporter permease [Aureimonas fodinaquatilis]